MTLSILRFSQTTKSHKSQSVRNPKLRPICENRKKITSLVKSNISQWIDLIFGFKQSGDAALDVHNLFHPLFYEGQVDVFSIQDPLQRNAAIGFINNFGQIPTRLFSKAHPQRKGPWNRVSIAEATLIAGLKNAFYHKLNQGRFLHFYKIKMFFF